jgi:hypothetical protein
MLIGAALATATLAGCGSGDDGAQTTGTGAPATASAKAEAAPFTFAVDGADVTVTIDADEGSPSTTAQPVTVACANLADDGFADRIEANATWAKGAPSVSVTLPSSAAGLDLCAINFSAQEGKQAVAFFNDEARAKYLADQGGSN